MIKDLNDTAIDLIKDLRNEGKNLKEIYMILKRESLFNKSYSTFTNRFKELNINKQKNEAKNANSSKTKINTSFTILTLFDEYKEYPTDNQSIKVETEQSNNLCKSTPDIQNTGKERYLKSISKESADESVNSYLENEYTIAELKENILGGLFKVEEMENKFQKMSKAISKLRNQILEEKRYTIDAINQIITSLDSLKNHLSQDQEKTNK